ncbi:MAG: amidohydrolase family protein [Gammaproteobacteria bacterium]|nr:amidohydrolase family protein [Gammaproteobacteria bacterium]
MDFVMNQFVGVRRALFWVVCGFLLLGSNASYVAEESTVEEDGEFEFQNNCDITSGSSEELIVLGKLVLRTDYVDHGVLHISKGRIVGMGLDDFAKQIRETAPDATVIDCEDAFVSPGLVNPHEHLRHSGGIPDPKTEPIYDHRDEWRGVFGEKYALEFEPVEGIARDIWVELRHLLSGTTTLGASGGVTGLVKNATTQETSDGYLIDFEIFPYGWVSKFHDMDCPQELEDVNPRFSEAEELIGQPYLAHVAEGTNCAAALEGQAFLDFVAANPGRRYSLLHGVGLSPESIARLDDLDVTLVWSPRSNVALYDTTAKVIEVMATGARVALGSDWSYSGSYNMLEEIQCADRVDNLQWEDQLSGTDYWVMSTSAGAYSLGLENEIGRLNFGMAGDIVIFQNLSGDFFQDLLDYEVSNVIATIIDGSIRSGNRLFFDTDQLPAQCQNYIDNHFVCVDWSSYEGDELTTEGIVEENRQYEKAVPLFEPKFQAPCLDD